MSPALGALLGGRDLHRAVADFRSRVLAAGVGPTAAAFWRVALAVPALWIVYCPETRTRA